MLDPRDLTAESMEPSVAHMFVAAVERYPERSFLRRIDGERDDRVTYGEAARRVAALVEHLRELGLAAGERVVTWIDELEHSVYLNVACLHAGVVPVPIGGYVSLDAALALARRVQARCVFTAADRVADVEAGGVRALPLAPVPVRHTAAEALAVLREAAAQRSGRDLYVFQPTSGTTGEFKLVMRTHFAFVRVARIMAIDLQRATEPPARLLLVAALTHGMGQYLLATALHLAAELGLTSRIDTASSIDEVRRLDPTYACVTPRVLTSYHRQHAELGRDPDAPVFGPSLRTLMTGGAVPDPALLAHAMRHGIDYVEVYGASEFSLVAATERGKWQPGVVGTIVPDVELKLADDGELLARSPARMVGYYEDDARTREAFTADGFYRTGDFCDITPDGKLRYVRRKRDVFNTRTGANIFPVALEEVLERLPGVAQVMLVGDQRPYLVALVAVAPGDGDRPGDPDGFLDPGTHTARYAAARTALARRNAELQPDERVERFALLARPFPTEVYAIVGHGKVRRDRAALAAHYGARIAALYAPAPDDDPTIV